jgi:hypothetical protein
MTADDAAEFLTLVILETADKNIPKKTIQDKKSTHPWVNRKVIELVMQKNAAAGTERAEELSKACSVGTKEEYAKYVEKEKTRLRSESRASKGWWARTRRLLRQQGKTCSIPALRKRNGEWCRDAKTKADHLAETFKNKYKLDEAVENHYTRIEVPAHRRQEAIADVKEDVAERILESLRGDSATGPDLLPARMLKELASCLAKPLCKLARRIIAEGRWPEIWITHWIVPLHKRNNVFAADNYRGVHLTPQLSKAMERLLRTLFMPFLLKNNAFGPNQYAYIPERGARDALANLLLIWLTSIARGRKVAVYCSDVSGAFDRVSLDRLAKKLRSKKVHPAVVDVLVSWLRNRRAKVVVGGEASAGVTLSNMVFQGTVLGPPLWNVFYEDARHAIHEMSFEESVFADDLNAYRVFPATTPNPKVLVALNLCQKELHEWGHANQVAFDAGKESIHIISMKEPHGVDFKMLGVEFDTALTMKAAVDRLINDASWKLKMLIRTRRFYNDSELVTLYKAQLLAFLEYRTPAIYHVTRDILRRLDRVQSRFLEDVGLSQADALMEFNLAPLATRRDIAMMGLLHRTAIGKGPPQFRNHFEVEADGRLKDPRAAIKSPLVVRSALGLAALYNMLPDCWRKIRSVKDFQRRLQELVKQRLTEGCLDWEETFSPRVPLTRHALIGVR